MRLRLIFVCFLSFCFISFHLIWFLLFTFHLKSALYINQHDFWALISMNSFLLLFYFTSVQINNPLSAMHNFWNILNEWMGVKCKETLLAKILPPFNVPTHSFSLYFTCVCITLFRICSAFWIPRISLSLCRLLAHFILPAHSISYLSYLKRQ